MFPVAFGFFDGETTDNWTWFMQQLHKAIRNPPHLAIISDACKGLENAIKTVYSWAEHRECFVHLMKNFSKRFQGPGFGRIYPAARTFQPDYHEYLMNKLYAINKNVEPWLKTNHKLKWMRSKFSEHIKCDAITSNVAEVWNNWVKDLKDLPPANLADSLRSKFMELYARRRIGEKFEGHIMLPVVVRQLYALSRELGHLKVKEGGREEAEVTEVTDSQKIIRHVVNIKNHICTCREWQVSGKPCPHAMALITTCRNPKMEEYLHPYFSVYNFRLAYGGVIRPLPDLSQWARVNLGFKVLPPLEKWERGRQRKLRIPSCVEGKGRKPRGKGMWQVQCKKCLGLGHRSTSPKCPMNGTAKKRKSRAKGKAGRPPGSTKRQKVAEQGSPGNNSPVTGSEFPSAIVELEGTSQMNTSPGPVTRRQPFLAMAEIGGSNQITTSLGPVTTSQPEEAPNIVTTPTKSPAKCRL